MSQLAGYLQGADPLFLPPREEPYVLKDVVEKVVYGCLDEFLFDLGNCFLRFKADGEFDTISGQFHPRPFSSKKKGYRSVRTAEPWKKYIGNVFGWTWLAVNQQGYLDSVVISFEGIEPNVLLQTIASSINIFTIAFVERTIAAAPTTNGKRAAKDKR